MANFSNIVVIPSVPSFGAYQAPNQNVKDRHLTIQPLHIDGEGVPQPEQKAVF